MPAVNTSSTTRIAGMSGGTILRGLRLPSCAGLDLHGSQWKFGVPDVSALMLLKFWYSFPKQLTCSALRTTLLNQSTQPKQTIMPAKKPGADQPAIRNFSSLVVDGMERAPSRSMLRAVGFNDADFKKPQIGVASTWSRVTPCNMHIDRLASRAAEGADAAGAKAVVFNTITVSDGISMGTEGMKYSLVSREIIADSIEAVAACQGFDALVTIGGCDKNMPACLIGMARLNRPSVFVYGGTILPGNHNGKNVDIVTVFEAVGARAQKKISQREVEAIERAAIPGPGSCSGMYTANTMASAIETLGMSLPNSSARRRYRRINRRVALRPAGRRCGC